MRLGRRMVEREVGERGARREGVARGRRGERKPYTGECNLFARG